MGKIVNSFFCILFFFFALTFSVYSSDIKKEMDLGSYLGIDNSGMSKVVKKLDALKSVVRKKEAKKKRYVTFGKPAKFFDLSDKYFVLAYSAKFKGGDSSVVGFLIGKLPNDIEIPDSTPYLIWKGNSDLKSFQSVSEDALAKYFRGMGVNDVYSIYSHKKLSKRVDSKADRIHFHKGEDIKSGRIDEKYIDPAITRDSELLEALSRKADITMVSAFRQESKVKEAPSGYASRLQQMQIKIDELKKQVERLQYILNGVVRKNNEIYFSNVNIHILNGTGKTDSANATGNIIIGYNENGSVKGSHSLVVGKGNKCDGAGNIISGLNNRIRSSYGTVIGGQSNQTTGSFGAVIGGKNNHSSGKFSVVAGGESNKSKGNFSIISGGKNRSVLNKNPHFTQ